MSILKKIVVVAGAGPGMGYAIARRFVREGFDIALLARDMAALQEAAHTLRQFGINAIGVAVDLTSVEDLERAFSDIRQQLGEPSVLVYNAAKWHQVAAMEMPPAAFTADLSLSITGALACAQQVYRAMKAAGAGTMLFTGGGLALNPQYGVGVSSLTAGKAGLRGFVYALHGELAPLGIRVGTVTIAGMVAPDTHFAPDKIAEAYWQLHSEAQSQVEIVFDGKA
jgi:NAD(P)-dependent dehydrogenase (short-subunit alcohol dehydrogenase family)